AACSSANLNWHNESLIVPNGSYALTANDCIKCICLPSNLSLQYLASGIGVSCSHLQCKNSHLFIGDILVIHTAKGCNASAWVYRGHYGLKIFRSLLNSSSVQCPGNNQSNYNNAIPPLDSPSFNPMCPSVALPPLLSPSSAPYPTVGIDGSKSNPRNNQNFNISSFGELSITHPKWCISFLVELVFCLFL
ncbi:hypothetical protein P3X46_034382, partial [Hevea brasiliensis]